LTRFSYSRRRENKNRSQRNNRNIKVLLSWMWKRIWRKWWKISYF